MGDRLRTCAVVPDAQRSVLPGCDEVDSVRKTRDGVDKARVALVDMEARAIDQPATDGGIVAA